MIRALFLGLCLALAIAPSEGRAMFAASPPSVVSGPATGPETGPKSAPVHLARCDERCRHKRARMHRHHRHHARRDRRHGYRHYRRPPPVHHYHHHHRNDGNAAAAAIIGGIIGLGIGAAIANSQPDYYDGGDPPSQFGQSGR